MRGGGVLVLLTALAGTALPAQRPRRAAPPPTAPVAARSCVVSIDTTGREGVFIKVPGGNDYQIFLGGGVIAHCANEPTTTMDADSLAWYPERNEAHFLGSVHFRDSATTLEADRLTYFVRQERLYAEGNVHTQNLRTRSDLRGPNLDYRRSRPGIRDTTEMYATRRPTIRFYSSRDSARARGDGPDSAQADSSEPFVIVADRARMRGDDQMWAGGQVTVDRSDLAARGDSAALDLAADRGLLLGGPPTVDGKGADRFRLTGTRIAFGLGAEHDLRRVLASGEADATGPDWRLRADTLDLALDSSRIQRTQAWGRTRRPDAFSGTYTIVADSLDVHMPAQVMREVWAFGRGRATTRPDSTVTEDDWMTGDTLHAVFTERDSSGQDSTGRRKQELRRLTSFGSARSLYHVVDEQHRDECPGINYSRGQRIEIAMREGKVSTVDVVGHVDGVYLEPVTRRIAADSAAAAPSGAVDCAPATPTPPDSARVAPSPRDTTRAPAPAPAARDSVRALRRPLPDTTRPRQRPVQPVRRP
jgi:lipopolysaccharide export system protein LptA